MKITIPSRVAPQAVIPDGSRETPIPTSTTATATTGLGRTIKIRQSSAANTSASQLSPPLEAEPAEAANNGLMSGKRSRTSLTPVAGTSGTATPTLQQRQTRQPDAERTQEDGIKLYNTLKDYKRDGRPLSTQFLHLPPRQAFPDYYELIKKPISFAEVKAKLDRREYPTLKAVADDFQQMFVNAKRYNQKGSEIFTDAKRLHKLTKTQYARMTGTVEEAGGSDDEAAPSTNATATSVAPTAKSSITLPAQDQMSLARASAEPSAATKSDSKKPSKKKQKTGHNEKPVTLTKWLSLKVDDLVAVTDSTGRTIADIFMQLPPPEQYPDYYQLIQRPVSFQLVRSRLKNRNYPTIEIFTNDVKSIFTNAQFYNEEGSQVWQDAEMLHKHFDELMKDPVPEHLQPKKAATPSDDSKFRLKLGDPNAADYNMMSTGGQHGGAEISFDLAAHGGIDNITFNNEDFDFEDLNEDHSLGDAKPDDTAEQAKDISMDDIAVDEEHADTLHVPGTEAEAGTSFIEIPGQAADDQKQHTNSNTDAASLAQRQLSPLPPHILQQTSSGLTRSPSLSATKSGSLQPHAHKRRVLAKAAIGQIPAIKQFRLDFVVESSSDTTSHILDNTFVRQHSLVCPPNVERIDVVPYPSQDTGLQISARPQIPVAGSTNDAADQQKGAAAIKWLVRPQGGLNVLEITAGANTSVDSGQAEGELYRVYIVKTAF